MKATIRMSLVNLCVDDAQRTLTDTCQRLLTDGVISDYSFEIETPQGVVGDSCILAGDSVVA